MSLPVMLLAGTTTQEARQAKLGFITKVAAHNEKGTAKQTWQAPESPSPSMAQARRAGVWEDVLSNVT